MAQTARLRRRSVSNELRRGSRGLAVRCAAAVLGLVLVSGCSGIPGIYVVEKSGRGGGGSAKFDATAYVDKIWAPRVVPTAEKNAVAADTLLPALEADQKAASARYGKQAGAGSPYSFLVKGSGTARGTVWAD